MEEKLISIEEAQRILPLKYDSMRRLAARGKVRAVKTEKQWLVYESSLREYIERNTNTPAAAEEVAV